MRIIIFVFLLTMISFSVNAKLNLDKQIPGGSDPVKDGEELYQSCTAENALVDIRKVSKALDSFTKLTDLSRKTMSKELLRSIGNTAGDTQNIGFDNWIGGIEATVLKQEYQIKKLKHELAQKRFKLGEIKQEELQKAKKEYEEGEKKFQEFWDSYGVFD